MPDMSDPFAIYVHWPFCLSKCPYCDFNSHVRQAAIDEPRFVTAFAAEIAMTARRAPGRSSTLSRRFGHHTDVSRVSTPSSCPERRGVHP